ncbi:uncharacterized protein LOC132203130 [Neocloeon triangulifer]|uniref:uncharacterized protein LOC132203130 n=1 Tax=Neocloeon triangulifer TaxID=2078957 RepID=UPI00286F0783|nr:uncharacterized protein LOC132203130 [Neocloeon triangulifer]
MKIFNLIWLLAICCLFAKAHSEDEANEKIRFTDCWNYGKNRSIHPAPVFGSANEENLSSKDCGRLNGPENNRMTPWSVYIKETDSPGRYTDHGVLVSDQTIICDSWCIGLYKSFKLGKAISVFGGDCGGQECAKDRGLLQQKVLDAKEVKLELGRFYTESFIVFRIEKVELTPNFQPVCLWNGNNQNDVNQTFYSHDVIKKGVLKKMDFLPEKTCYEDDKIEKGDCDLYGNSIICSSNPPHFYVPNYLYVERAGRFYLRALWADRKPDTLTWLDLLPFTNQIVTASADLSVMPEIAQGKNKTV